MDNFIISLTNEVFENLVKMDSEVNIPIKNRKHGGLMDYGLFVGYSDNQYEVPIYNRLAQLLDRENRKIEIEKNYPEPHSNLECDLFINDSGQILWLETKVVWKHWFGGTREKTYNRFYMPYFFGDYNRTDSVKDDFYKLEKILPDHTNYLSFLLIGFDSLEIPIDPDVKKLFLIENLAERGWEICGHKHWEDISFPKCRNSCWFFAKKVR